MDLSKLSDQELEELATTGTVSGKAPDVTSMSDAELEAIVSGSGGGAPAAPAESSILDDLGKVAGLAKAAIVEPAKKMAGVFTAPMEVYDQVAAAPVRAGIGAIQRNEGLGGAGSAMVDQFLAGVPGIGTGGRTGEVLPSTPTGEEIAFQGLKDHGVRPEFAADIAPFAGAVTDAALDVTNLIPTGAVKGAGKALAAGAVKAEAGMARAIARTGQRVTGGALKAEKALQMFRELKAREMINPGTFDDGRLADQVAKLGEMREDFRQNRVTVPGSHDVAQAIGKLIGEGEYRAARTPGSARILEMINERAFEKQVIIDPPRVDVVRGSMGEAIEVPVPGQAREVVVPKDLTLDELDDVIRAMDDVSYTPAGNVRQQNLVWGPFVKKSRAMADEVLQTVPQGALFKAEKQRASALMTAGKKRSKLLEAAGDVGAMAAIVTKNPVAFVTKALTPKAFVGALATLKVPRDMMNAMKAAHETGRLKPIREVYEVMATKYPEATERVMRASVLMSGKPTGQQFLTPEEAGSLDKIRVFDPDEIIAEKARIENDKDIPSTEKAARLSKINRDGYITYDGPPPSSEPKTPEQQVFGGKEGMDRLMKALEGH